MKKIRILFFMIALSIVAINGNAQKTRSIKNQQKAQADKKKSELSQKELQLKGHQKHHLDIQSKNVRKRMKQNERDRRKGAKGRKHPFYKRWFKRKNHWK